MYTARRGRMSSEARLKGSGTEKDVITQAAQIAAYFSKPNCGWYRSSTPKHGSCASRGKPRPAR